MKRIQNIEDISQNYQAIFCDIWGVVHNGLKAYEEAINALYKLKNVGKQIILITNSPRSNIDVAKQLKQLNINDDIYDFIITSGDLTRDLIEQSPSKIFYIGPEKAMRIMDGLNVERVEDVEAQAILCTGLFEHFENDLTLYEDILLKAKARNLPFICANPDIQVLYGEQILYCAGALAKLYSSMGGKTLIAGKPHSAIYDLAFSKLSGKIEKKDILAIGDGLVTDIKGAINYGIDAIYVLDGVNKQHLMVGQNFDDNMVQQYMQQHNFDPLGYMDQLR